MIRSTIASTVIFTLMTVSGTNAQQLQQPLSVKPASFKNAPSPTEAIAPTTQPQSQIPITQVSCSTDCDCPSAPSCGCAATTECCSTSCSSNCGNDCDSQCGLGKCLGLPGMNVCSFVPGLPIAMQLMDSAACGNCNCDPWTLNSALHGDCEPCISVGGWFQAGYHTESNNLFNDRPDELNLHQAWTYIEKVATCESPLGFRADFMYGIDGTDTQAFGNTPGTWDFDNGFDHGAYSWAIPQLYAELQLGEINVKVGHFFTLIGYEVVTAPDNFFYSHAITMYNSEPFTHTGAIASRSFGDALTVYGGWTAGWDTGFDQFNDGSSWLGGASLSLGEDASLTYMSTAGNFGARGDDAYSHSLVFDAQLTDNLNYVVQSDLLRVDSTGEDNVGLNQYLFYDVRDCVALGARLEWWKGDVLTGYAPHGGVLPAAGSLSYYAATLGANIQPSANLTVRPEVRYDWSPAADYDEVYLGVDAIFTF